MRRLMPLLMGLVIIAVWGWIHSPKVEGSGCRAPTYYSYPSYSYSSSYYTPTYSYSYPQYKEEVRIREIVIPSYLQIPLYGAYYTPPVQQATVQSSTVLKTPGIASEALSPGTTYTSPNTAPMPGKGHSETSGACADATRRMDRLERQFEEFLRRMERKEGGEKLPPPPDKGKTPPPKPVPEKPKEKEPTSTEVGDPLEREALAAVTVSCIQCHDRKNADSVGKKGKKLGGGFVMTEDGKFVDLTDRQWVKVQGKLAIKQMPPEHDQNDQPIPELTNKGYGALIAYSLRRAAEKDKGTE